MQSWKDQLLKGIVELCVMAALRREQEMYGYEIFQRPSPGEWLSLSENTVYAVLARLERAGLAAARTARSPIGPPRRYHRLTARGQRQLHEMKQYWRGIVTTVERLLKKHGKD